MEHLIDQQPYVMNYYYLLERDPATTPLYGWDKDTTIL